MVLLLSGAPAAAASVDCVWDLLPQARQEALVESIFQDGMDARPDLDNPDFSDPKRCGLGPDDRMLLAQLFVAGFLAHGAEAQLTRRFRMNMADVDRAWAALPASEVDLIHAGGLYALGVPTSEAVKNESEAALRRFAAKVSPNREAEEALMMYAAARVLRDHLEAIKPKGDTSGII